MLTGITKAVRFWAAITLVAGYVICVVAPTAALAFGEDPCALENAHSAVTTHVHHDGSAHDHGGHDGAPADDKAAAAKCCGLVVVCAIAPHTDVLLASPVEFSRTSFAITPVFTGLPPDRLKRPPKA
jgi:hypothetical protein